MFYDQPNKMEIDIPEIMTKTTNQKNLLSPLNLLNMNKTLFLS